MTGHKITEQQKEEIRAFYLSKPMSYVAVAKQFNLCTTTVSRILADLPKYTKARMFNPDLDEHFFQHINSDIKAYFLGLIIADGNVFVSTTDNRQASISITLDLEDEYLLNAFKNAVKTNTSVGHDGRGCGQIAVRSDIMAAELAQYGVVPRKSDKTYLPHIDKQYMGGLLRGIFDGDGSIVAKPEPNSTRFVHRIAFCGTHQLMQDIYDYMTQNYLMEMQRTVYDYKDRQLSELHFNCMNDIYLLGELMYQDATVFMKRKHNIYMTFKEHYNFR